MISGLRYYYRLPGMNKNAIALPSLKKDTKLPVILNHQELSKKYHEKLIYRSHNSEVAYSKADGSPAIARLCSSLLRLRP
jgi:hypothetical protein